MEMMLLPSQVTRVQEQQFMQLEDSQVPLLPALGATLYLSCSRAACSAAVAVHQGGERELA